MSADLAIGIKVGFGAGAAVAGLTSLKRSMNMLGDEVQKLSARQRMLGDVLANPLNMSKQRVGELKHEYVQLGATIDKLRQKQASLGDVQMRRDVLKQQRGELLGQVASTISLATTAIIPVKLAMDFESSMADVKKVVDFDTPQQFKQMGDDVLKLTRSIPMAGTEIAAIVAAGGQSGVAKENLIGFATDAAKMGVAFDMAAGQAGESMATLSNVLQIPIPKISALGDAINHLSDNANSKASDIVNVLTRVGSDTKQLGLTENQAAALGSTFLSMGKAPELAAQAIKGMTTSFSLAKVGKFDDQLKQLGLNTKTFAEAMDKDAQGAISDFMARVKQLPKNDQYPLLLEIFGENYADDVQLLAGNVGEYNRQLDLLGEKDASGNLKYLGSMQREFENRSATTANQLQLFKNNMIELGVTVGSTLLPAVNSLIDAIKPIIAGITDWARANPAVARSILGFVAGLALFKVTILGSLFGLNIFKTALLFFPSMGQKIAATWLLSVLKFRSGSGLVFKTVSLVKTALGGLRSALPLIKAFGQGMAGGFIGMAKVAWMAVRGLSMGIVRLLPMIGGALMKLGLFLMANPIFIALGLLAAAAYLLYRNWDGVVGGAKQLWQDLGDFFGNLWTTVSTAFQTAWSGMTSWFSSVWEGIKTLFADVWEGIKTTASDAWESIKVFFSSGIANISATIVNWAALGLFYQAFAAVMSWFGVTLPAQFTGFGSMILQGLWNGLKVKFEEVKGWFSGVVGWFGTAFQKANDIHSPSRLFRRFGGYMMQGLQIGLNLGASMPLSAVSRLAQSVQQRFKKSSVLSAPSVPPLATPSFTPPAPAPRLFERLGDYAADVRNDLADKLRSGSSEFATARQDEGRRRDATAPQQAVNIHFNPTIHAPGGDVQQIQTALQMSLREFEELYRRMMDNHARRAY